MKLLKYSIIFLFLTSCDLEQVVPYELPYEGDKLVVWSYIQPEETVEVTVSPTYEPLGLNTVKVIDDAIVELYENDALVATLQHSENGVYTSSFYPTVEKSYHLKVSAPDFEEVVISEKVVMPLKPEILDIVFLDSISFPTSSQIDGILEIAIHLPDEDYITFRDMPLDSFNIGLNISSNTYLSDCSEKVGSIIPVKCLINQDELIYRFRYNRRNRPDKVILQLATISDSFADFYLLDTDFEQGFSFVSEPINIYTNMQGGYGLLAAYNPFIYEFELL